MRSPRWARTSRAFWADSSLVDSATIVRDILRVDHAGEYGAIRIYGAQRVVARCRAPDLIAFIDHALADERRHRDTFGAEMAKRGIRPCNMLPLWGIGGTLLGGVTALLGREAILVCTQAVERTVHQHMDDQSAWLRSRGPGLAAAIDVIRDEEAAHLAEATAERRSDAMILRLLDKLVAAATELLVWLSTYGASSRLRHQLNVSDS